MTLVCTIDLTSCILLTVYFLGMDRSFSGNITSFTAPLDPSNITNAHSSSPPIDNTGRIPCWSPGVLDPFYGFDWVSTNSACPITQELLFLHPLKVLFGRSLLCFMHKGVLGQPPTGKWDLLAIFIHRSLILSRKPCISPFWIAGHASGSQIYLKPIYYPVIPPYMRSRTFRIHRNLRIPYHEHTTTAATEVIVTTAKP